MQEPLKRELWERSDKMNASHPCVKNRITFSGVSVSCIFQSLPILGTYLDLTTSGGAADGVGPGLCLSCHESCAACTGASSNDCLSCPVGASLQNRSVCVENCDIGKPCAYSRLVCPSMANPAQSFEVPNVPVFVLLNDPFLSSSEPPIFFLLVFHVHQTLFTLSILFS